ncbi:MAG: hypothetical protein BWY50_00032 [Spirochaetes bacterium ADurb.Bin315]|nr:MAG: hypothetical protein BWY50_00032 [Spirochaetes bacterium ADurb.Bin315]
MKLWSRQTEITFFEKALKKHAPEKLFYALGEGFYAYVPKKVDGEGQTLQSRNSLIGTYTEEWCKAFFEPIAKDMGLFAVNGVVCEELGLTLRSSADLAFCATPCTSQTPENIKLLFEIKMSVISNYSYTGRGNIIFVGDYSTHKGNPSLLRSDSMLKAIGKPINIRVSGYAASRIPIIVLGNSPITENYQQKVDFLKKSGVIQGFWSLYPNPTTGHHIVSTSERGFQTFFDYNQVRKACNMLLDMEMYYFSTMLSRDKLGEYIRVSSAGKTNVEKAEKFLELIRS